MVKGIVNGTTTYYPRRHYNKEITNNIPKVQKFYIAGTMTIAVRTDGVLQWILPDHLGSTSTTANADGTLNSVIKYTAFGEIRATQGVTPTKYRYTGQLSQAELGLDYYVARWYDPVLGHFTQADTLVPEPGKASAYDRYAYSNNNPINYNDPTGHWIETALDIAFIAYDIYDIQTQGWNLETGLSLAADVAGVILPCVTGGGLAVKALMHADDAVKGLNLADNSLDAVKIVDNINNSTKFENSIEDAGKILDSIEIDNTKAFDSFHGNSRFSSKTQSGYEIYDINSRDVVKTGISGGPLNKNGTLPRANKQINLWNKQAGFEKYEARITRTNMPDRQAALRWERINTHRLDELRNSLVRQKRPGPKDYKKYLK